MSESIREHLNRLGDRQTVVRSSALSTLHECKRKFFFRERFGLVPYTESASLTEGTAMHEALQMLLLGTPPSRLTAQFNDWMRQRREQVAKSVDSAGFMPDGTDATAYLRDMELACYKGLAMASFVWANTTIPKLIKKRPLWSMPGGGLAVEVLLQHQLMPTASRGNAPTLVARYDAILTDYDYKNERLKLYILDHKSTSIDPLVRAQALALSPQAALYYLILTNWLKSNDIDADVAGIIHCIVRKPTIKYCPNTKDKGGVGAYIERVAQWYQDAIKENQQVATISSVDTHGRFFRERLQEVLGTLHEDSPYFTDPVKFKAARSYPRAGDYVCHKFNTPCPFLRLCTADDATWEAEVQDHYKVEFRDEEEVYGEEAA